MNEEIKLKLSPAQARLFRAMELDVKLGIVPENRMIVTVQDINTIEVAMLRCIRTAQGFVESLRATHRRIA